MTEQLLSAGSESLLSPAADIDDRASLPPAPINESAQLVLGLASWALQRQSSSAWCVVAARRSTGLSARAPRQLAFLRTMSAIVKSPSICSRQINFARACWFDFFQRGDRRFLLSLCARVAGWSVATRTCRVKRLQNMPRRASLSRRSPRCSKERCLRRESSSRCAACRGVAGRSPLPSS